MKYEIEVKKTLKTDNNKKFFIGSDIAFSVKDYAKNRIIGRIIEINDDNIKIDDILIDKEKVPGEAIVALDNILEKSCSYVYVD